VFLIVNKKVVNKTIAKPLNCIKPQSSLSQVRCARGANTFPSHNQFLICESLTRIVHPGFLLTLNQILSGDSQEPTNKRKSPSTLCRDVRQNGDSTREGTVSDNIELSFVYLMCLSFCVLSYFVNVFFPCIV
jgi:hypothetical protein